MISRIRLIGAPATSTGLKQMMARSYRWLRTSPDVKRLGVILAVALVIQVVYFVRIQAIYPPEGLTTDLYYQESAENILSDGIIGFAYGAEDFPDVDRTRFRPPLYSVVLAGIYGVFGANAAVALGFNVLFLLSTVVVVYLIGRAFSPAIGVLAAVVFLVDPINIITTNKVGADNLFALLVAVFILVTLKAYAQGVSYKIIALSSLVLGLATLTRAVTLYLAVPLLGSLFIAHLCLVKAVPRKRLVMLSLVFLAIQGAIIGGWMVRNNSISGNPTFASMTATHLYGYFVPLLLGQQQGLHYDEVKIRLANELQTETEYLKLQRVGDQEKYVVRKSMGIILDSPVTAVVIVLKQIPILFLDYPQTTATLFLNEDRRASVNEYIAQYASSKSSRLDVSGYTGVVRRYMQDGLGLVLAHGIFFKLYYLAIMVSGAIGLSLMVFNRSYRPTALLLLAIVAYMILISSTWAQGRLRFAILPAYSVLVAYSLVWYWDKRELLTRWPIWRLLRRNLRRDLSISQTK